MVRKVKVVLLSLVLICTLCATAQASTHPIYDTGTLSTTYITYFKDILSGAKFTDNYVAFRSGQNEYTMIVGKLQFENGIISLEADETGKEYRFYSDNNNYNTNYKYEVKNVYIVEIETNNSIIYSDVGDYPELVERGSKYEMLQTLLVCVALLCIVIGRVFYNRKR